MDDNRIVEETVVKLKPQEIEIENISKSAQRNQTM